MKKLNVILVFVLLAAMLLPIGASASSAYATYTYSSDGTVLESPDAYSVDTIVDSTYMGGDGMGKPTDITVDDKNIYIVDAAGANGAAVVVLDDYYKYQFSINQFVNEQGVKDGFANPRGMFVNDKYIYVCDTDNSRIVIFDKQKSFAEKKGVFVATVGQPVSNLFEEDSIYKPIALAVDSYGRMFIVSSTTTEGIIVMNDDGSFYGFIGAQKTTGGGSFSALWERFRSSAQKAADEKNISKEFNNICIDKDNFIYVTTDTIEESVQQAAISSKDGTYAPVRKLNASGKDVMRRNGFFAPSGEVSPDTSATATYSGASTIVDAAVGPEGTWSIVDQKRSKIFTYDAEGNLLFAFGDMGGLKGNMGSIVAITYKGDKLMVLGTSVSSLPIFTVYRRTEYGDILINALRNQNNRQYDSEVDDWKEILKRNNNFDVAYIGVAKAFARSGQYENAKEFFKLSHQKDGYSSAFKETRKIWASKYFIVIPIVIVAFLVALAYFLGYAGKVNERASIKVGTKSIGEELLYSFHLMVHPFDGFWDLKHEKRGSIRSAFIIMLFTIIAYFYQSIGTSYIFTSDKTTIEDTSIYKTIILVAVPLILWIVANWCWTTLFDGEGTFSDIFTASCYALVPLALFTILKTVLSNVLAGDEKQILTVLGMIGIGWTGILLFVGMMSVHGYSVGKNIIICICTVIGMIIIVFLALLFSQLIVKIVSLVSRIYVEISYRV